MWRARQCGTYIYIHTVYFTCHDGMSARIRFNVSGVRFETTVKTLQSAGALDPDFVLALICDGTLQPDENGEYFFDRPSDVFRCILTALQTGELDVPSGMTRLMEREVRFYGLASVPLFRSPHFEEASIVFDRELLYQSYVSLTTGTPSKVQEWRIADLAKDKSRFGQFMAVIEMRHDTTNRIVMAIYMEGCLSNPGYVGIVMLYPQVAIIPPKPSYSGSISYLVQEKTRNPYEVEMRYTVNHTIHIIPALYKKDDDIVHFELGKCVIQNATSYHHYVEVPSALRIQRGQYIIGTNVDWLQMPHYIEFPQSIVENVNLFELCMI